MAKKQISKVKVWRKPSGELIFTFFCPGAQKPGETEADFIARGTAVYKALNPDANTWQEFTFDQSVITALGDHLEKVTLDAQGTLGYDSSKKLNQEVVANLRGTIMTKLKAAGLSEDEIKVLVNRAGELF
jgi:3-oxoacyl-[acyl-carrier-protein] synthase III